MNEEDDTPTPGGTDEKPMVIQKPLVLMFEDQDGMVVCHIHPNEDYDHESYGLIICDLVRHVAGSFKVEEEDIWNWVDKERRNPTSNITQAS